MAARSRLRDFQKLIPRSLRAYVGKPHVNKYVSAEIAPNDKAVKRVKQRWALEYDTWFDYVKSLPEPERKAAIDAGGLEAIRQRTAAIGQYLAENPTIPELLAPGERDPDLAAQLERVQPGLTKWIDTDFKLAAMADRQRAEVELPKMQALLDKADGKRPRHIGNGMRELFEEWAKTPLQRTGRPPEITRNHKSSVERFVAVCGNLSVREITREHIRQFYAANDREMPDKPAARTKHAEHIKALLNLAAHMDWRDDNPADKLRISVASTVEDDGDDENGKSFTPEQLTAILAAAKVKWKDKSDELLALRMLIYGGFRSNEACQLRSKDIETKDGFPCVRVRKGPGQSVKNKSSRRYVPLHHEIADELQTRTRAGNEWLFPSFPHKNPKKHNARLTAAFNGRKLKDGTYTGLLRGVCGITDPDLTLHCVRHSFKDACRRARVDEETRKEMMGHGKGCEHEKYGIEMLELAADAMLDINPLSPVLKARKVA
jgi:integrase